MPVDCSPCFAPQPARMSHMAAVKSALFEHLGRSIASLLLHRYQNGKAVALAVADDDLCCAYGLGFDYERGCRRPLGNTGDRGVLANCRPRSGSDLAHDDILRCAG